MPPRTGFGIVEVPRICQDRTTSSLRSVATAADPMRIALFEPDIPQNAGTIMRMAACLGVAVDLIEPAGFVISDRRMRRAGMDYLDRLTLDRHSSWATFCRTRPGSSRLVLLSTHATTAYTDYAFAPGDTLLLGRESAGVTDAVRDACDAALCIPLTGGLRSLNVATAAAMVLGEALRQTGGFPPLQNRTDPT
jgi:tRNA (cytidine/uridine-2'-O-)-methyltransferase